MAHIIDGPKDNVGTRAEDLQGNISEELLAQIGPGGSRSPRVPQMRGSLNLPVIGQTQSGMFSNVRPDLKPTGYFYYPSEAAARQGQPARDVDFRTPADVAGLNQLLRTPSWVLQAAQPEATQPPGATGVPPPTFDPGGPGFVPGEVGLGPLLRNPVTGELIYFGKPTEQEELTGGGQPGGGAPGGGGQPGDGGGGGNVPRTPDVGNPPILIGDGVNFGQGSTEADPFLTAGGGQDVRAHLVSQIQGARVRTPDVSGSNVGRTTGTGPRNQRSATVRQSGASRSAPAIAGQVYRG